MKLKNMSKLNSHNSWIEILKINILYSGQWGGAVIETTRTKHINVMFSTPIGPLESPFLLATV